MHKIIRLAIFVLLFINNGVNSLYAREQTPNIIVWRIEAKSGVSSKDVESLSGYLDAEVQRISEMYVVSQSDIETVLRGEEILQKCGKANVNCMAEVGAALGALEAISGDLGRVGGVWILNLRRVNLREVKVLYRTSRQAKGDSITAMVDALPGAVKELFVTNHFDLKGDVKNTPINKKENPDNENGWNGEEKSTAPISEESKDSDVYLMIEPRLGINLALDLSQENDVKSMLAFGISMHYVLPWLEESIRLGMGMDYWVYNLSTSQVGGAVTYKYLDELSSIIILLELEYNFNFLLKSVMPESLLFFRPLAGLGAGVSRNSLLRTVASNDGRFDGKFVESDVVSFALGIWAGCRFDVWNGGPLVMFRYIYSKVDHVSEVLDNGVKRTQTVISGAEHGGLQFYAGYQFEL